MATGDAPVDGLSTRDQERIERALTTARTSYGLDVSVLVGDLALPGQADAASFRAAAELAHAALGERAAGATLLVVAPGQRRVEVVTGPQARRRVPDRVAALAVLGMTTAFAGGDLVGGVVDAVRQICDAAGRRPALAAHEGERDALGRPQHRALEAGAHH